MEKAAACYVDAAVVLMNELQKGKHKIEDLSVSDARTLLVAVQGALVFVLEN